MPRAKPRSEKELLDDLLLCAHDMLGNLIDAGDDNYRDVRQFRGALARYTKHIEKRPTKPQRYPIGTIYLGKQRRLNVVVDFWTTKNLAGEIVRGSYVTEHDFLGQKLRDYNVPEATIARNLPPTVAPTKN